MDQQKETKHFFTCPSGLPYHWEHNNEYLHIISRCVDKNEGFSLDLGRYVSPVHRVNCLIPVGHVTRVCEREDWTCVRYLHYVRLLGRWKVSTFALSAAFPPDRACARNKISLHRKLSVCPASVSRVTEHKNTGGGKVTHYLSAYR